MSPTLRRAKLVARKRRATSKTRQQFSTDEYKVRQAVCERFGPARYDPVIDPANFVRIIDNPYFPLIPGTSYIYEGRTREGVECDEFAVTNKTRQILGVTCVEAHDS